MHAMRANKMHRNRRFVPSTVSSQLMLKSNYYSKYIISIHTSAPLARESKNMLCPDLEPA